MSKDDSFVGIHPQFLINSRGYGVLLKRQNVVNNHQQTASTFNYPHEKRKLVHPDPSCSYDRSAIVGGFAEWNCVMLSLTPFRLLSSETGSTRFVGITMGVIRWHALNCLWSLRVHRWLTAVLKGFRWFWTVLPVRSLVQKGYITDE